MMARLLALLGHRLLAPAVCAIFLAAYVVTSFFTDETLVLLIGLIGRNPLALGLLLLGGINSLLGACSLWSRFRAGRQLLKGSLSPVVSGWEMLDLAGKLDIPETAGILKEAGYRVAIGGSYVAAWRGLSLLVPRLLWKLAIGLAFLGIMLSLAGRKSTRMEFAEGEPLPVTGMPPAMVERIELQSSPDHWFYQNQLSITLAQLDGNKKYFGIYPPGVYGGTFVYPRYLSLAPLLQVRLPNVAENIETTYRQVMIYPPGREDIVEYPGGYRLFVSLVSGVSDVDPFIAADGMLNLRLVRDNHVVAESRVAKGSGFAANGHEVRYLGLKRFVVTDLVRDPGVPFVWGAVVAAILSLTLYLPIRLFLPKREVLFVVDGDLVKAYSRAEGRYLRHGALFHDLLDRIVHG